MDKFYEYKAQDGSGVTISIRNEFKRVCQDCGKLKSIGEFGLRRMAPGSTEFRDQPCCSPCRKGKAPEEETTNGTA